VYQTKLREQPGAVLTAYIFDRKKTGHPLMIGKESDREVKHYVTYMRSTGTAVKTAVVIEGILLQEAPDLLSRVNLNKGWVQYVLQRMGFVKRKAKSKAKVTVEDFSR